MSASELYAIKTKDIDGKETSMQQYAGKVLLIVNTASECGYTKQYAGLEKLHEKYKDRGFFVLGFPSNDFGAQEPGSNEEIKHFCEARFGVTFPLFEKAEVKGPKKQPLYAFLTERSGKPYQGDIKWNFNKFVIGKSGNVVARFDSGSEPTSAEVEEAIEKALGEK